MLEEFQAAQIHSGRPILFGEGRSALFWLDFRRWALYLTIIHFCHQEKSLVQFRNRQTAP